MGGATRRNAHNHDIKNRFQSTLPVGGATTSNRHSADVAEFQSTLPVGGATLVKSVNRLVVIVISIHAPRGGSDRGVTTTASGSSANFNPRSPWGERPDTLVLRLTRQQISIHAPRGGSDFGVTLSGAAVAISIHAPRGGSDLKMALRANAIMHFNPRSPWGERQIYNDIQ